MSDEKCPIWGTPAEIHMTQNMLTYLVVSERAGGKYLVDDLNKMTLSGCTEEQKILLTDWLVEQRYLGVAIPELVGDVDELFSRPHRTVKERCENLLRFIEDTQSHVGDEFSASDIDYAAFLGGEAELKPFYAKLRAYTSSLKDTEITFLANQLLRQNYIEELGKAGSGRYVISLKGYEFLEKLRGHPKNSKRAFVAMWFGEEMQHVYDGAIAPGIIAAGYEPVRIDNKQHNNKIDDEIVAEIRRARFVVADFTHGPEEGMRGGVYYEAGFARGLGLEVISTCEVSLLKENKIHFDTRQFNHIGWSLDDLEGFGQALSNRISATVGDGPLKESR